MPTKRLTLLPLIMLAFCCVASSANAQDEVVERWFDRAERFAAKGLWRRAGNYYAKVVAAEPDDEEAAAKLATALMGSGGYDDLDPLSKAWLAKKPEDRTWLLRRHDLLRETGRDEDALAVLTRFLGDAKDYEIESLIGRIHQDHGRDEEAKRVFEAMVDRAKNEIVKEPRDLTGLARAYLFWRHGGDNAEEALVEAQEKDPEYLPAYLELAEVYGGLKELPSDMLAELKKANEIRPRWPAVIAAQIRAHELRLGMAEDRRRTAIKLLLEINPKHPEGLYRRGMRGLSDALWDKARASFEKGLDTNPNHKRLLAGRAALDFVTHKTEAFEKGMARILELDPTCGEAYGIVAEGLSERRRWDESLAMMEKAVAIDPEDFHLWDWLARYALYLGEEGRGREALTKADALTRYGRVWRNNMNTVMGLLEKKFATRTTEHYVIKMHEDDVNVLEKIVPDFLERSYAEFAERYGIETSAPVIFDVFQRQTDFSVRTMGTRGLGALGVCFGPSVYMYIPRKSQRPVNWASTAHHEMAHVFTLQRSRGRVPRWLTEGLSSWEEVRRNPSWGRNMEVVLHDALHNEKILGVLEFDSAFYGPRIIFAYFQGGLASQFIEQTWGIEAIRRMLTLYGDDKLSEEVLAEALGVSAKEYDERFLTWVREMLAPLKRIPTYDEESIKRFEALIAEGKDVERNQIKAAWGHFRAGRLVDANAQLKPLVDAGCEDPEFRLLLAERARVLKRNDEARKIYEELMAAGFEDVGMTIAMAQMLDEDGKGEEALAFWKLARKQHPWNIDPKRSPYIVLAARYRAAGDEENWAREMAAFCSLVDIAVDYRGELVDYHEKRGDRDEALRYLDEMILVKTFDPALHVQRAELLVDMGRKAEALAGFELALEIEPGGAGEFDLRLAFGRLLIDLDRKDDAVYHLVRATELKPDHAEAKKLLEMAEIDDED